MSKINKFSIYSLVLLLAFAFVAPSASAITWRDRFQQVRQRYQAARGQYLREVNSWRTARQDFLAARTKYRRFKNSENKAAYEQQVREFLKHTLDVLIKRLETLKKWVDNRQDLSEADQQAIITEIDKDIKWLQDKQTEVDTASLEQLRQYAGEVRTYWRGQRWHVKKIVAHIWSGRLDWMFGRFNEVVNKVQDKINELKAAGQDTTQLEAWLTDLKEKINLAKEKEQAAKEKYQAINNLEKANSLFVEARQFINQAHQDLKQAHQDLIKIIKGIKDLNSSNSSGQ